MGYILRPYQEEAAVAGIDFLKDARKKYNAIEVLPTGSGKSLIIANIAAGLGAPTLIFQPSKEILEQNFAKYISYGNPASIYSASVGQKRLSPVTFATIGSVIRKPHILSDFKFIIIDECHFVNAKQGMYRDLLKAIGNVKVLGLTATPYRLVTDGFGGSILKFLTRTRPRVFRDVIYHVQNEDLFSTGYLARLKYVQGEKFDRSKLTFNTTGADYTDKSVQSYYDRVNFKQRAVDCVNRAMETRKNALVFTRFIKESEYVVSHVPESAIVTGETPKAERERIIEAFKSGTIKVVCNVGVLTTGFDFPELETIILARPTMSLALYYQMIGRGIRPNPRKECTEIVDICDNYALFGPIEKLRLINSGNGKWIISNNGRKLTNIYYGERKANDSNSHSYKPGRSRMVPPFRTQMGGRRW